jgi:predicted CopG family antitoxin
MAVKTITIDLEAYEALRLRKGPNQSFSDVIKERFRHDSTGATLRAVLGAAVLAAPTLDATDEVIASRRSSRARAPKL